MKAELIKQHAQRAGIVGTVSHEDFVNFIIPLSQRKKGENGWETTESPYMSVDGRVAMAVKDHIAQGKRLDFGSPTVLQDTDESLTLLVTITSEIYGTRHGIATSRKVGGQPAEREMPWEVAETSAVGRALGFMGYGIFPGSGIASAEDVRRANSSTAQETREGNRKPANGNETRPRTGTQSHPPISPVQKNKLTEVYRLLHGGSEAEVESGLDKLFLESFKHGIADATYEEGARITGALLSELRSNQSSSQLSDKQTQSPQTTVQATGRTGTCPAHKVETKEYSKDGKTAWHHKDGEEKCNMPPAPETIKTNGGSK